ncbi:unnamed protein product [Protopolystoma xenopodis]|uniref:Cation-transporting P-type ATPase C-terminal domain-containing protein n=1 Tax=Protopolystoma xenopodis TaxID=117903 RepID=A0A448XRU2_9PLAT|nr:unnamed protein product [Protopolystoma xenopodis]
MPLLSLIPYLCSHRPLGERLLDVDSGRNLSEKGVNKPTEHFTAIFNTFVLMTLFNEANARKIHGQRNIFSGLHRNVLFIIIWIATFILQASAGCRDDTRSFLNCKSSVFT